MRKKDKLSTYNWSHVDNFIEMSALEVFTESCFMVKDNISIWRLCVRDSKGKRNAFNSMAKYMTFKWE